MKQTIKLKIDVSKIDKSKLFKGQKGTYLDAVLFLNDEVDQYGNNGMIVQSVTKEEREKGIRGAILGNASPVGQIPMSNDAPLSQEIDDDLPF
jgi:hypothetical protein